MPGLDRPGAGAARRMPQAARAAAFEGAVTAAVGFRFYRGGDRVMRKTILAIALGVAAGALQAAELDIEHCKFPEPPVVPEGAEATEAEMGQAGQTCASSSPTSRARSNA